MLSLLDSYAVAQADFTIVFLFHLHGSELAPIWMALSRFDGLVAGGRECMRGDGHLSTFYHLYNIRVSAGYARVSGGSF